MKVYTQSPHPRSCLPQNRITSNAWLRRGYKWLATLANSRQLWWAIFASELSWSWPRPSSGCISTQLSLCPILLPPLPFHSCWSQGTSSINVLHPELCLRVSLLERPTYKGNRRRGSPHAQSPALGHEKNCPEYEPDKAFISCRSPTRYHSRGSLEQLSPSIGSGTQGYFFGRK